MSFCFCRQLHVLIFQQVEEHSLFPTAVSEEELEEASKIVLAPGGGRLRRPEQQGSLIIQSKAAEQ